MEVKETLEKIFSKARGLYLYYQTAHWTTVGPEFYGDHLLYQRLYEDYAKSIDQIAEKSIGLTLDADVVNTRRSLQEILLSLAAEKIDYEDLATVAGELEEDFIKTVEELNQMEISVGLANFLGGLADKAEEHLYLLQNRGSMITAGTPHSIEEVEGDALLFRWNNYNVSINLPIAGDGTITGRISVPTGWVGHWNCYPNGDIGYSDQLNVPEQVQELLQEACRSYLMFLDQEAGNAAQNLVVEVPLQVDKDPSEADVVDAVLKTGDDIIASAGKLYQLYYKKAAGDKKWQRAPVAMKSQTSLAELGKELQTSEGWHSIKVESVHRSIANLVDHRILTFIEKFIKTLSTMGFKDQDIIEQEMKDKGLPAVEFENQFVKFYEVLKPYEFVVASQEDEEEEKDDMLTEEYKGRELHAWINRLGWTDVSVDGEKLSEYKVKKAGLEEAIEIAKEYVDELESDEETQVLSALSPLEFMKDAENQLKKLGVQIMSKTPKPDLINNEAEDRLAEIHGKDFFHKMPKDEQGEYLKLFPKSRFA